MKKNNIKVAVGLSGGVDSAVSAALLKEQGYEIVGVFLECWNEPGCRTDKDRKDALGVALKLKIPFKVVDLKEEYRKRVMKWCYLEFKKGRTPNPDVICNKEIKFGVFFEWAMGNGFDRIATGHYARHLPGKLCKENEQSKGYSPLAAMGNNGRLFMARDKKKDQTYFLAMVKKDKFKKTLFPIGEMLKSEVRKEAKKRGFKVWDKKDSMGICFIGKDLSFKEFLKRRIKVHKGEVIDKNGKVVGRHDGVEFYTIGQRHGFKVRQVTDKEKALYVVRKDVRNNRLVVGGKKDLERDEFEVEEWSWISSGPTASDLSSFKVRPLQSQRSDLFVRIRHGGKLVECVIEGERVKLKKKVEGVSEGQVVVVYKGNECFGGGVINGN